MEDPLAKLAGLLVGTVVVLASRAMPKTMLLLAVLAMSKNWPLWEYTVSAALVGIAIRELKDYLEKIEEKEKEKK